MNAIYDVLKKDHDHLKTLLKELVSLRSESPRRSELLNEIRDEVIPHSRAEEAVFYNSLRSVPVVAGEAMHGYREHVEAETLLRTLQLADKVDITFQAAAVKLKDALEHHIKEEEEELFELAKGVVTPEEAKQMAEAFEALKPKVKAQNIVGTTLDMIANMLPPRYSRSFREHGHKTLFREQDHAA